jgi:hypothetical protein
MGTVVVETFIARPPEEVFAYLRDYTKELCKNNFRTLTTDLKQKQNVDEWCNSSLGK